MNVKELKASKSEFHKGCKFTFIVTTEGSNHFLNIKVHTPAYLDNYEIKFKVYSHYDKAAPVCYSENAREGDICRFSVLQQMLNFILRQSENLRRDWHLLWPAISRRQCSKNTPCRYWNWLQSYAFQEINCYQISEHIYLFMLPGDSHCRDCFDKHRVCSPNAGASQRNQIKSES